MSAGVDAQGTFLRFPSGRGAPLATVHAWLAGKRRDDGAEGLWRVHDKVRLPLAAAAAAEWRCDGGRKC